MNAAILSIGDELTLGQTVDTNSAWLSSRLVEFGILTQFHLTVPDDQPAIVAAIRHAARIADLVIITGGLGPTADDLTRQALAEAMGVDLVMDAPSLEYLKRFFARRNRVMSPTNQIQAMIPAGAAALPNDRGTAPGIHVRFGQAEIYVFPGVPHEACGLFDRFVFPMLQKNAGAGRVILTAKINTFGLGESDVGSKLGALMDRKRNPTVGTTVAGGLVSVRIRSEFPTRDQAQQEMDATLAAVEAALGHIVFSRGDESLQSVVFKLLKERGKTIATAESCTGGLVGKMLTDLSGSSEVYLGGFVTYSNDAKIRDLRVPAEIIAQQGAVSTQTAEAMAAGALSRTGADYALSITGIAGPTGGSDEKPVGTVCFGLADRSRNNVLTLRLILPGDREMVRDRAAKTALNLLRLRLLEKD